LTATHLRQTTPPGSNDVATQLALWSIPVLLAGALLQLVLKLSAAPLFIDFLTMWTGGRLAAAPHAAIYDPAFMDRAQVWFLGDQAHDRPFPYPPSSLLVLCPLGRLAFWPASLVWMSATLGAFAAVVARLAPRPKGLTMALVLIAPGSLWAALSGQCVFLTGSLAISGLLLLERRPALAGALLGAAAAFKPTVVLMAPLALIGGGHWRSLIWAGITGLGLAALSGLLWGFDHWLVWLTYAPNYLAAITSNRAYVTAIVAPAGLAARLGLVGPQLLAWRLAFALIGAAGAVLVFRRSKSLWARLTALFGASLVAAPYAMNYELTLLIPGAVLALFTVGPGRPRTLAFGAYWSLALAGLPVIGPLLVFVYLALALACGRADEAGRLEVGRAQPAVA
jgi:hypothetical protein